MFAQGPLSINREEVSCYKRLNTSLRPHVVSLQCSDLLTKGTKCPHLHRTIKKPRSEQVQTSKHSKSAIRGRFHNRSVIRRFCKIRESVQFFNEIRESVSILGQIRRSASLFIPLPPPPPPMPDVFRNESKQTSNLE